MRYAQNDATQTEENVVKTGSMLAIIVFVLVAIAHGMRLLNGVEVTVGGSGVPQWASVVGLLVPALIALQLWRERKS
jgi:hypothetical protein